MNKILGTILAVVMIFTALTSARAAIIVDLPAPSVGVEQPIVNGQVDYTRANIDLQFDYNVRRAVLILDRIVKVTSDPGILGPTEYTPVMVSENVAFTPSKYDAHFEILGLYPNSTYEIRVYAEDFDDNELTSNHGNLYTYDVEVSEPAPPIDDSTEPVSQVPQITSEDAPGLPQFAIDYLNSKVYPNMTDEDTMAALKCVFDNVLVVRADLEEFGLDPDSFDDDSGGNAISFICLPFSDETAKLGSGERRALLRDYFNALGFNNIWWEDVQRIASGVKPVKRNLANEQANVSKALPVFKKIFGHSPVFSNAKEDLAWNTLLYRIRFSRDLEKEKYGITRYRAIFGTAPTTPLDWSAVRILGYIK